MPGLAWLVAAPAVHDAARRVGPDGAAGLGGRVSARAEQLLARLAAIPVPVQALAALLLIVFYAERIWTVYRDTGLFRRLGFDWGLFYSQASALAAGDVAAMYHVERLGGYVQRLALYTTTPDV